MSNVNELVPLLTVDGYTHFLIGINDEHDHYIEFEVFEVNSWECDDAHTPTDPELYVAGSVKWDGCSHVTFGEKDNDDVQDGYLHLCGEVYWKRHAEVMLAIYELAKKKIRNYDPTCAEAGA